jgi:hypothetical protein
LALSDLGTIEQKKQKHHGKKGRAMAHGWMQIHVKEKRRSQPQKDHTEERRAATEAPGQKSKEEPKPQAGESSCCKTNSLFIGAGKAIGQLRS